jgi:hypothetical protein
MVDVDHDSDLDLFIGNFADIAWPGGGQPFPDDFKGESNRLYRNNGNGTFTEVSAAAGLAKNNYKTTASSLPTSIIFGILISSSRTTAARRSIQISETVRSRIASQIGSFLPARQESAEYQQGQFRRFYIAAEATKTL